MLGPRGNGPPKQVYLGVTVVYDFGSNVRSATVRGGDILEADAVLTFVEWSQGCCTLDTALDRLSKGFGAVFGAFARINTATQTARIIDTEHESLGDYRPATELAAYRVFKDELTTLKPGSFICYGQYMRERLYRDPAFEEWLEAMGARNAAFMILGRSAGTVDLVEFYFDRPYLQPGQTDGDWGGAALARIYAARRPGVVADCFAQKSAADETGAILDEPLLGPGNVAGLTRCEWRVCVLVSRGLSVKGIAYELDVSVPTVRAHLRKVYNKTGLAGFQTLALRLVSGLEQRALLRGPADAVA